MTANLKFFGGRVDSLRFNTTRQYPRSSSTALAEELGKLPSSCRFRRISVLSLRDAGTTSLLPRSSPLLPPRSDFCLGVTYVIASLGSGLSSVGFVEF